MVAAHSDAARWCGALMWTTLINVLLAAIAVTIGFWIAWGELPVAAVVILACCVAGALLRLCASIGMIWAAATLLIGLESLAWPVVTMVQISGLTANPTDEQMTEILTSVVGGLFSSIFWLTFSWGIYRWTTRGRHDGPATSGQTVRRESGSRPSP